MKKNVLALSIATAVVGFAGSAHAVTDLQGANADGLQFGDAGTGHMLLVPYFSTQNGNATLLSLINTDTVNGKAVKVRFRGALNSDDIFDFQVFLSPGDVWTANVSQGKDGKSFLTTEDATCTKPAKDKLNATPFITTRLNYAGWDEAAKANQTREGYIEIFNMADIVGKVTDKQGLFPLIKHVKSVAKCADDGENTAWTALNDETNSYATLTAPAINLRAPTTGLAANWTIMNVPKALSWSGAATAIEAVRGTSVAGATGNLVYFPQTNSQAVNPQFFTADPLLAQGKVVASQFDLPDMSTPYTVVAGAGTNTTAPAAQATKLATSIATKAVINEYWTEPNISAETDWVFSMPTRRYAAAVDYTQSDATKRLVTNGLVNTHFAAVSNIQVNGPAICTKGITNAVWDREENKATQDDVVVSPGDPQAPLCGEVSVISFNSGGKSEVLGASVAVTGVDGPYTNGWAVLNTTGITGGGLPILGQAFVKAYNPSVAAGTAGNFGVNWTHRAVRP